MVSFSIEADKARIRKEIIRGIIQGLRAALQEFLPTVAQDTGRMSNALETTLLSQIVGVNNKKAVDINLTESQLSGVPYAKYHIVGPNLNPNFNNGYDNPTTPGTKPIDLKVLMALIKQKIEERIGIIGVTKKEEKKFRVVNADGSISMKTSDYLIESGRTLAELKADPNAIFEADRRTGTKDFFVTILKPKKEVPVVKKETKPKVIKKRDITASELRLYLESILDVNDHIVIDELAKRLNVSDKSLIRAVEQLHEDEIIDGSQAASKLKFFEDEVDYARITLRKKRKRRK